MSLVNHVDQFLADYPDVSASQFGTIFRRDPNFVSELKKGRVEIRNEANAPIIHTKIGKVSFSDKNLKENLEEIIKGLKSKKPAKADPDWIKSSFLSATMGPSIKFGLN